MWLGQGLCVVEGQERCNFVVWRSQGRHGALGCLVLSASGAVKNHGCTGGSRQRIVMLSGSWGRGAQPGIGGLGHHGRLCSCGC
jgi:hypothetical protein